MQAHLLQQVSLQVAKGEVVTLIGPNGAGKTSLVKLVCGLVRPSAGEIVRAADLRIGYVPQRLAFDATLPISVHSFLALTGSQQAAAEAMQRLQIEALKHSLLHSLSGGELQRVLLARALLRRPSLLILDEPAQGVDINGQLELYQTIADLRDELNCGVLMVSHDLHWVMAKTDTVYCLNRHICCQGAPELVSQHPEYLQLFGQNAPAIAIYTHHHDHEHNLHGDVVPQAGHIHGPACNHQHSNPLSKPSAPLNKHRH
ncbi:MAG TPA: zinc ABC transporter ATP-binding protein ZnuC [Cellvibrionaceae bacterium]|nr:zinc ABC transporter ATP-binding protein ZnuC [Cellvibrionaceae bacterium]